MAKRHSEKWSLRFAEICLHVAQWSKDPSTKVGACIVDENKRILGLGYNGFPRGVEDSKRRLEDKQVKYKHIVHAEANAILNAVTDIKGAALYVAPLPPCTECVKLIIQSGIKQVYVFAPLGISDRWKEEWKISRLMLVEAGVEVFNV